jgi:hypothetical protein
LKAKIPPGKIAPLGKKPGTIATDEESSDDLKVKPSSGKKPIPGRKPVQTAKDDESSDDLKAKGPPGKKPVPGKRAGKAADSDESSDGVKAENPAEKKPAPAAQGSARPVTSPAGDSGSDEAPVRHTIQIPVPKRKVAADPPPQAGTQSQVAPTGGFKPKGPRPAGRPGNKSQRSKRDADAPSWTVIPLVRIGLPKDTALLQKLNEEYSIANIIDDLRNSKSSAK